jgi:hypothetical protein
MLLHCSLFSVIAIALRSSIHSVKHCVKQFCFFVKLFEHFSLSHVHSSQKNSSARLFAQKLCKPHYLIEERQVTAANAAFFTHFSTAVLKSLQARNISSGLRQNSCSIPNTNCILFARDSLTHTKYR